MRNLLSGAAAQAYTHFVRMREALEAGDAEALDEAHEDWNDHVSDLLDNDDDTFETWQWGLPGWSRWDGELLRETATRVGGPARDAAYEAVDAMRSNGRDDD